MNHAIRTVVLLGGGAARRTRARARHRDRGRAHAPVNADVLAPPPPVAPTRTAPADAGQLQLSFAPVARRAAPAVVNVYSARVNRNRATLMDDPFFRQFFGGGAPQPRVEQSLGSGVIVQSDGLIVTNNHVVARRRRDPRRARRPPRIQGEARLRRRQVGPRAAAIDTKGAKLPVIRLGDSDRAEVGDVVLAVGNPFGVGQTVTHGIVSAVARTGVGVSDYQFFIQTDAAINPGNSGGALLDLRGDLVGINSAIYSRSGGSHGIGFAIPGEHRPRLPRRRRQRQARHRLDRRRGRGGHRRQRAARRARPARRRARHRGLAGFARGERGHPRRRRADRDRRQGRRRSRHAPLPHRDAGRRHPARRDAAPRRPVEPRRADAGASRPRRRRGR